ncbi:hypothetical protein FF38_07518 [Lucilia cuprina]|uniref:Uncharacterized protein n=1 Tax=Lucilia cuprina TaxID=7375 RepID=A0A0L0CP65_LUCCU|nr:hypothetical protein FF38_07518 [Lucilia cuprina]
MDSIIVAINSAPQSSLRGNDTNLTGATLVLATRSLLRNPATDVELMVSVFHPNQFHPSKFAAL